MAVGTDGDCGRFGEPKTLPYSGSLLGADEERCLHLGGGGSFCGKMTHTKALCKTTKGHVKIAGIVMSRKTQECFVHRAVECVGL